MRLLSALGALALLAAPLGCAEDPAAGAGNPEAGNFAGTLPNNNAGAGGSALGSTPGNTAGSTGMGAAGSNGGTGGTGGTTGSGGSGTMNTGGNANTGGGMMGGGGSDMANGGAGGSASITPTGLAHVFTGSTDGRLGAYLPSATDGSLTEAGSIETGNGLDFVNVATDGRTVFVSRQSSVTAYSYDPANDTFAQLDQANTGGSGTHVAVSPGGSLVVVAHYNEGAITALPFVNGQFGTSQAFQPGNNAHQANFDAAGDHVFIPCLGSNFIAQYDVNGDNTLTVSSPASVAVPGGPRHMAFHATSALAFSLAELDSDVHVLEIDSGTGLLQLRTAGSVPTSQDSNGHQSSDVQITADGRFLYAVNRQPSEMVQFAVAADGTLSRGATINLTGTSRSFAIDANSEFLYVGSNAGTVITYQIDDTTGALTQTASVANLGNVNATIIRYLDTP